MFNTENLAMAEDFLENSDRDEPLVCRVALSETRTDKHTHTRPHFFRCKSVVYVNCSICQLSVLGPHAVVSLSYFHPWKK